MRPLPAAFRQAKNLSNRISTADAINLRCHAHHPAGRPRQPGGPGTETPLAALRALVRRSRLEIGFRVVNGADQHVTLGGTAQHGFERGRSVLEGLVFEYEDLAWV
jgi:hypothetical protein